MSERAKSWMAWFIGGLPALVAAFEFLHAGVPFWLCVLAGASMWIVGERVALRMLGASEAKR